LLCYVFTPVILGALPPRPHQCNERPLSRMDPPRPSERWSVNPLVVPIRNIGICATACMLNEVKVLGHLFLCCSVCKVFSREMAAFKKREKDKLPSESSASVITSSLRDTVAVTTTDSTKPTDADHVITRKFCACL
jgi:hypothetical protein